MLATDCQNLQGYCPCPCLSPLCQGAVLNSMSYALLLPLTTLTFSLPVYPCRLFSPPLARHRPSQRLCAPQRPRCTHTLPREHPRSCWAPSASACRATQLRGWRRSCWASPATSINSRTARQPRPASRCNQLSRAGRAKLSACPAPSRSHCSEHRARPPPPRTRRAMTLSRPCALAKPCDNGRSLAQVRNDLAWCERVKREHVG